MRIFSIIPVISVLFAGPVWGQVDSKLYTHPSLPSAEQLRRLSLELAWYRKIPTAGRKDGIATFQLLPDANGDEVLVQTRVGLVQLRDAETGDLKWSTPVGLPYRHPMQAGFNSHSIYISRGAILYALDRATGKHRLFDVDKLSGLPVLGTNVSFPPSTGIVADEAAIFYISGRRLTAYLMPKVSEMQVTLPAPDPSQPIPVKNLLPSPQPTFHRTFTLLGESIIRPPVLSAETVVVWTNGGTLYSVNKFSLNERFHFQTYGLALAGIGHYGNMAYAGSSDKTLYALNTFNGKLRWRYLAGSAIVETPQTTDKDIFVTTAKSGLCRVNRKDGRLVWKNPGAYRFLATNEKFVYALDQRRYFLVLDYIKGTTMSKLDLRDFVVPYSNTLSDRIYFANHDGKMICLRHEANNTPFRPKTAPAGAAQEPGKENPDVREIEDD